MESARNHGQAYNVMCTTDLVPNGGLFDSSEVLKGREKDMAVLRATDVLDETTELLA